jgi:hypothetical protein
MVTGIGFSCFGRTYAYSGGGICAFSCAIVYWLVQASSATGVGGWRARLAGFRGELDEGRLCLVNVQHTTVSNAVELTVHLQSTRTGSLQHCGTYMRVKFCEGVWIMRGAYMMMIKEASGNETRDGRCSEVV